MKYTINNSENAKTFQVEAKSPEEASYNALKLMGYTIEEKKEKEQRYFFHAHMDKNFVKKGDRVKQYKTKIGTIGDGNSKTSLNNMSAHDHFGAYIKISVETFYDYIFGWTKEGVEKYYLNPHELALDFKKIYPETNLDIGKRGYDWLQPIENRFKKVIGYHPAVDINDKQGGNSDFGQPIYAPCDGVVIHEKRTWFSNRGWGNVIIIKED